MGEIAMGYDVSRFVGVKIENEFLCSICTDVLEDPVQGSCEHVFCSECIKSWLNSDTNPQKCPNCRGKMSRSRLKNVARYFKSILGRFLISCEHLAYGCPFTSVLDNSNAISQHQKECQFHPDSPVKCDIEGGCGSTFSREHMKEHNCVSALKQSLEEMSVKYKDYQTQNKLLKRQIITALKDADKYKKKAKALQ